MVLTDGGSQTMTFQQVVKIPDDRIGVIIGRKGKVKDEIQQRCQVTIQIDSQSGNALVSSRDDGTLSSDPFKAVDVVYAISKGFSPERAYRLLDDDMTFQILDLRDHVTGSSNSITRVKGRIIGESGKSRRIIEDLTGAYLSVYGHTVSVIGSYEQIKLATDAIVLLIKGSPHKTVYASLQEKRSKSKLRRMQLWENDARSWGHD